ncbi:hypothetical protein [Taklimakanibacter deserti]|uniref:hypothetical protein n=1 Tax=Taklimakanibacter deserti TaxID=2267839 RepID=UPI000E652E51
MNKLSKFSLAVFGGVSVLMLAVPADAATGRVKFRASVDEIRRYCERLDEDFWRTERTYGCGNKVGCYGGKCTAKFRSPPPPPPPPPPLFARDGSGNGGGGQGGQTAGGGRGDGNSNGNSNGRGSSSAGGPN